MSKVVAEYFNNLAEILAIRSKIAGSTRHGTTTGGNREIILQDFFRKHMPKRLNISQGGVILGSSTMPSKQIDLIISGDSALHFRECEQLYACVDTVAATISVKSSVDNKGIPEALEEFSSIPQGYRGAINFASLINDPDKNNRKIELFLDRFPGMVLIGYDGCTLETFISHFQNYYKANPSVPYNRRPKLIWVNKKYIIQKVTTDELKQKFPHIDTKSYFMADGDKKGIYVPIELSDDSNGLPFFMMLSLLTSYIQWENDINFELINYYLDKNSF